jgi:hypothetical protein
VGIDLPVHDHALPLIVRRSGLREEGAVETLGGAADDVAGG